MLYNVDISRIVFMYSKLYAQKWCVFFSIIEICSKNFLEATENCLGVERTWLGLGSRGKACDPPAPDRRAH